MKKLFYLLLQVSLIFALEVKEYPILSEERLELTKAYSRRHYDMDTYFLHQPKAIVIHSTGIGTLKYSLQAFKSPRVLSSRYRLATFGLLNVGCHFVVGKNGETYSLLPTTIMGRHVVGYNHVAIGIENVAAETVNLTETQIYKNAEIVAMLLQKHPSIEYLFGHHEYMVRNYPHFSLRLAKDESYVPPIKIDPGFSFMEKLRRHLKSQYGIVLKK